MARNTQKGFQSVGSLLPKITTPVFQKHSHVLIQLIHHWIQIVGADYGRYTAPVRLSFSKGETTKGLLYVMVESRYALEFQHLIHVIIEKINQTLGFQAISRIMLQQTSFPSERPTAPQKRQLSQGFKNPDVLFEAIEAIDDEDVKAALRQFLITIHDQGAT